MQPCGPKRPIEQKIACAYWDSAQMNIQWKYPHEHPLPVDAPPEFGIDAPALGPAASAPATRDLYWHRLRQVWYVAGDMERNVRMELGLGQRSAELGRSVAERTRWEGCFRSSSAGEELPPGTCVIHSS